MKTNLRMLLLLFVFGFSCSEKSKEKPTEHPTLVKRTTYLEPHRPQFHFSPEENWMNDPNGLVFHQGVYHLFYQYYPDDIVWGPMHWGHAVSKDLVFWEHKPIALYPDEHGYIFSGSAVVDQANTSGFGTEENPPLVAIYTYHDPEGEKANRNDFQTQGIAYSLDGGDSWEKYDGNPVIGNDGIRDFRDPKVFWHGPSQQWIMVLVAGDHAKLYRSGNLKEWTYMSDFGKDVGAHGGVWECPDLFPMKLPGSEEEIWAMTISINPGAPNGGSGTQYFLGAFDGIRFTTEQKEARWLDWGRDNYAGITYNNAPDNERIFIGWMSNWDYAKDTPTELWRSAMTLPRKLSLKKVGDEFVLANEPLPSLQKIIKKGETQDINLSVGEKKQVKVTNLSQSEIQFTTRARDFRLTLSNAQGEKLGLTMDGAQNKFLLDRTQAGKSDFKDDFAGPVQEMPIPSLPGEYEVRIFMDWSSVEVFINESTNVMTSQLFPTTPYTELLIENPSDRPIVLVDFGVSGVSSVWE